MENLNKPHIEVLTGPLGADFSGELIRRISDNPETAQLFIAGKRSVAELEGRMLAENRFMPVTSSSRLSASIASRVMDTSVSLANERIASRFTENILKENELEKGVENPREASGSITTLISELRKAGITLDKMEGIDDGHAVWSSPMGQKRFQTVLMVRRLLEDRLASYGYATPDIFIEQVTKALRQNQTLHYDQVLVDLVDDYDPLDIDLLAALLAKSDKATIVLPQGETNDDPVYQPYREALRRLQDDLSGAEFKLHPLPSRQPAELRWAADAMSQNTDSAPLPNTQDRLHLHASASMDDMIEAAAARIAELCDEGAACQDIVVTGPTSAVFAEKLVGLLDDLSIPAVFVQGGRLINSSLYGFMDASARLAMDFWNTRNLLHYASFSFSGVAPEEARTLEEFESRFGPNLTTGLDRVQEAAEAEAREKEAEAAIPEEFQSEAAVKSKEVSKAATSMQMAWDVNAIVTLAEMNLSDLRSGLLESETIDDFCCAFLDYMESDAVQQAMSLTYQQIKENDEVAARRIRAEWASLNKVLLELSHAFGLEKSSLKEFMDVLKSQAEAAGVPLDESESGCVRIIPAKQAVLCAPRHLILVDMSQSTVPGSVPASFFGEPEIRALRAAGFSFPRRQDRLRRQESDFIGAVRKAADSVWIGWKQTDSAGSADGPAMFLAAVLEHLNPDTSTASTKDLKLQKDLLWLENWPKKSFASALETLEKDWQRDPERLSLLHQASDWMARDFSRIDADPESWLLGTSSVAITRLESFAKCPFSFFMSRGMNSFTPREYEETPADRGNLYHQVLASVFTSIQNGALDPHNLYAVAEAVESATERAMEGHNRNYLQSGKEASMVRDSIKEDISRAVGRFVRHLNKSQYKVIGVEQPIDNGGVSTPIDTPKGRHILLSGTSDRIDRAGNYVRVIDYKTNETTFTMDDIKAGTRLQLPLYLEAACRREQAEPGGMYYVPIRSKSVKLSSLFITPDDDKVQAALLQAAPLKGLTHENALNEADVSMFDEPSYTSDTIGLKTTAKRVLDSRSQAKTLSSEQFQAYFEEALKTAGELADRMLDGDTQASPDAAENSPCSYCAYSTSCHKNPGLR